MSYDEDWRLWSSRTPSQRLNDVLRAVTPPDAGWYCFGFERLR